MRALTAIACAIALLCGALHANAGPQRRFNSLVFESKDPGNPTFRFEQEIASCARPMGEEGFTVKPGQVFSRHYYEKLFEAGCFSETKELGWIVTATRPQDNFRWQCHVRLINGIDSKSEWWRVKIQTKAVEPVAPGTADLCTDRTLIRSAVCETTDESSFERADCLNQTSDSHGKIRITLGGPPMPAHIAPQAGGTLTTSPFD
ncbi:hypothetical protein [Trinickia sp.]|uniref:hypothetical protein n=1 Tax=Trinickia sp. TaxID=2571163 RepID=UPI003F818009